MSLLDEVRKIEETYQKKLAALEEKEQEVAKQKESVEEQRKQNDEEKKELIAIRNDLDAKLSVIRAEEEVKLLARELGTQKEAQAEQGLRLRTWENELAKVAERQSAKDLELFKREQELSEEKKAYKDKLKADFLAEVNLKLSKGL